MKLSKKNFVRFDFEAVYTGSKKCQIRKPEKLMMRLIMIPYFLPVFLSKTLNIISHMKSVGKNHKGPLPANEPVQIRLIFKSFKYT